MFFNSIMMMICLALPLLRLLSLFTIFPKFSSTFFHSLPYRLSFHKISCTCFSHILRQTNPGIGEAATCPKGRVWGPNIKILSIIFFLIVSFLFSNIWKKFFSSNTNVVPADRIRNVIWRKLLLLKCGGGQHHRYPLYCPSPPHCWVTFITEISRIWKT